MRVVSETNGFIEVASRDTVLLVFWCNHHAHVRLIQDSIIQVFAGPDNLKRRRFFVIDAIKQKAFFSDVNCLAKIALGFDVLTTESSKDATIRTGRSNFLELQIFFR